MSWVKIVAPTLAAMALTVAAMDASIYAAGRKPSDVPDGDDARVTRVISGDTIEVAIGANTAIVRYIGVNAPETGACFTAQATKANADLMNGKRVVLERDEVDANSEGQLLRYVYLLDGRMANEELIIGGYAQAETARPNIKHQGDLNALAQQAQTKKPGGWKNCGWQLPQKDASVCTVFAIETLMERVSKPPELSLLGNGDCVTIAKESNPAGAAWSGQYVYHPAGSAVQLSDMYVRWKDGFVLITRNSDGKFIVHYVMDHGRTLVRPTEPGQRPYLLPAYTESVEKDLVRDSADSSILRIPDNAWLLRDLGNGQYQALVDMFEYKSGDIRVPRVNQQGYVE